MKLVYAEDIRDITGPVDYPQADQTLFFVLALLLLCITAVFLWLTWRKKFIKKEKVCLPWEKALSDLNDLKQERYLEDGYYKQYYWKLSHILRTYIEETFKINAVEMTTEEFLTHLKRNNRIAKRDRLILNNFLQISDLVKFAKHQPEVDEAKKGSEYVESFVRSTQPKLKDESL